MSDTIAQVPEAAGSQTENQSQDQGAVPDGVQKRFDEMTAQKHAAQREAEDYRRQVEEMKAREQIYLTEIANRAERAAQPQTPDVDPEFKRQVEAAIAPLKQEMSRQLATLQAQTTIMQVRAEAVQRGLPDEVRTRAEKITEEYLKQGHLIDKEVAFRMAAGDAFLAQMAKQGTNQTARAAFNQPNPLLTSQGVLPAGQPQVQRRDRKSVV